MKKILIVDDQVVWKTFNINAINEILGSDTVIHTALSAKEGYDKILENILEPYDIVITDLQMEEDFLPKLAGEWFIEQINELAQYYNSKIIIVSAAPMIQHIADKLNVFCVPKQTAIVSLDSYKNILLN